ncbi:MAG: hypothetical protein WCG47_03660, partial [Dermatophilaceae bacterium]
GICRGQAIAWSFRLMRGKVPAAPRSEIRPKVFQGDAQKDRAARIAQRKNISGTAKLLESAMDQQEKIDADMHLDASINAAFSRF